MAARISLHDFRLVLKHGVLAGVCHIPIMSDAPSVVGPGEPTITATLLYTQPIMFILTVLPYMYQGKRYTLCQLVKTKIEITLLFFLNPYQSSHAQLQAKHKVEFFAFKPIDCICILGNSQRLASNAVEEMKK